MRHDSLENVGTTSVKNNGNETQLQRLTTSAVSLTESSTPEQVAAVGLQIVREIFPVREKESDLATRLRLEMLVDVVNAVGPDRFLEAVKQAITISDSRYHCTIRKIRQCAGLKEPKFVDPAYAAWELVTEIVKKHVRRTDEDGYRMEPYVYLDGDKAVTKPIPTIPDPVLKAVRALGGWQALATTPPEFWAQRMKDFVNLYQG